jgi:hypothetical protein
MGSVPEFTDTEQWTIQSTADERWGKDVIELHLADVEIMLNSDDKGLTSCPAVFWAFRGCNFIVIKVGKARFRAQFFYQKDIQQLGTGVDEFDDIGDCVVTLLRVQADHDSVRSGAFPGS